MKNNIQKLLLLENKLALAETLSNIPYKDMSENEIKIYSLLLEDEQLKDFANEIKK